MSASDCIPIAEIPHTSRLFREFAESRATLPPQLRDYYASAPQLDAWMQRPLPKFHADVTAVTALLREQNTRWGASEKTLHNIALLAEGARAVVTGQQVTLFGGPLYSLLKAATAVQLAQQATDRGTAHVPIFWLATEDHDFDEVNSASFIQEHALQTFHLHDTPRRPVPVGAWVPGECLQQTLAEASAILGDGFASDLLRDCYTPGATLADAFARLFLRLFTDFGLIVIDASTRGFHALAQPLLERAITQSATLHDSLAARSTELEAAGYHAQVLVNDASGLLFLVDEATGERVAIRRTQDSGFSVQGKPLSQPELLQILSDSPERISPNALLRPVMQDFLLPTAAYVGGPAEIAYFAQSQVLYHAMVGAATPIVPRLSATLVTPKVRRLLQRHEVSVPQTWCSEDQLKMRLGARAMPIEAKQKLSDAGNAIHAELQELENYANQLDEGLGHTARIASSKIRYQMNRLRRMMAKFQLERDTRLREHAETLSVWLYPGGILQERKISGMQFVADQGPELIARLVGEAADRCPGHKVIEL